VWGKYFRRFTACNASLYISGANAILMFSDAWQFAGVHVCYFRCRRTADEFAKKCKSRSQEAWPTSHYLFFIILGPLYISGKGKAKDFKFDVHIELQAYKPKNAKVNQKGLGLRHVNYLHIFVPLAIPVERLNLQTSNLVHRLTKGVRYKNAKK